MAGLGISLGAVKRVILGGRLNVRLSSYLHNVVTRTWWAAVTAAVAGCGSTPPPQVAKPKLCELASLKASVITSSRVNLSEDREPRPVQLRLYQLKNDTRFLNARFDSVWRSDAETLGDDLLKMDEVPVYPNSRVEMKVEKEAGARFLVAAGLFRNPKGRSWFTSFEFPEASQEFCEGESGDASVPEFFVWVEDTRVEDGSDHADEFPEGAGRVLAISAPKAPKAEGAAPGSAQQEGNGSQLPDGTDVQSGVNAVGDGAQAVQQVPGTPQAPVPQAPKAPSPNVGGGFATELP